MSLPRSVAEVLDEHVTLELECTGIAACADPVSAGTSERTARELDASLPPS